MEEAPARNWKVSLFGGLEIQAPDGSRTHVNRPKVAELLAFLCLRRIPIVDRDAIVTALWPDADPNSGRDRLRQTLSLLRHEVPDLPIVVHGKNALELDRSCLEVDTEGVESRAKWLHALNKRQNRDASRQLLGLLAKGLLPELSADWVIGERSRYEAMKARVSLDVPDSSDLDRGQFRFGGDFGGIKVPMVGRQRELLVIESWLHRSDEHVLVVTGPPGVGKTRLLKEAISRSANTCDAILTLSTVQASEVPWLERLGQMVGLHGQAQVADGLRRLLMSFDRPLIVVDDFDQADDATREWLGRFCHTVPDLKLLASARRASASHQTGVLELRPFNVDSEGTREAGDLLLSFATQFGVDGDDLIGRRQLIDEIARQLEGLPLSLEVAAGWLAFVRPDRLLEQLRSSMALVIDRAAQGRDTLKECVAAILSGLPDSERLALACLSVCHGGCGEDLAEEMLGSDWLWHLRSLNERSLLFRSEGHRGHRFVVLQAIRESVEAVERPATLEEALRRHRLACFALSDRATWEVNEGDRATWLDWLRDEGDNLLAACARVLDDDGMARIVVRRLQRLRAAYWLIRRPGDFRRVFRDACQRVTEKCRVLNADVPLSVVEGLAREMVSAGQAAKAVEVMNRHTQLLLETEASPFDIADSFDVEGEIRALAQEFETAMRCFKIASQQFQLAGYPRHALWMEPKITRIERQLYGPAACEERRKRALARAVELNDLNSVGMYSKQFALEAVWGGKWDEAQDLAGRAVEAFARVGEPTNLFAAYLVLASAQSGAGRREDALSTLNRASEFVPIGDDQSIPEYDRLWESLTKELKPESKPITLSQ